MLKLKKLVQSLFVVCLMLNVVNMLDTVTVPDKAITWGDDDYCDYSHE